MGGAYRGSLVVEEVGGEKDDASFCTCNSCLLLVLEIPMAFICQCSNDVIFTYIFLYDFFSLYKRMDLIFTCFSLSYDLFGTILIYLHVLYDNLVLSRNLLMCFMVTSLTTNLISGLGVASHYLGLVWLLFYSQLLSCS